MAAVETVNGPVDVEQLGRTLIHEHFRAHDEAMRFQFPHLDDDEEEWKAAMSDAHFCSTIDWFPREIQEYLKANEVPDWSMTFPFEKVIPELKERWMTDEQLDQMMVENPKRWLGS
jgi:predicted metal-dependent phosphotriesterase family hydrolase